MLKMNSSPYRRSFFIHYKLAPITLGIEDETAEKSLKDLYTSISELVKLLSGISQPGAVDKIAVAIFVQFISKIAIFRKKSNTYLFLLSIISDHVLFYLLSHRKLKQVKKVISILQDLSTFNHAKNKFTPG